MKTVVIVAVVLTWLLLLVVSLIDLRRGNRSAFEIERLARSGDKAAKRLQKRQKFLRPLRSLQIFFVILLVVVFVSLCFLNMEILWGVALSIVGLLLLQVLSYQGALQQRAQRLYERFEPWLFRHAVLWRWLSFLSPSAEAVELEIGSEAELVHLIDTASVDVLPADERLTLRSVIGSRHVKVADCMTPRSKVTFVKADSQLGPLTIDELHQTGFSRFPVINGDVDHIVGMLRLRDLLPVTAKNYGTVAKNMTDDVYYLRSDAQLEQALSACIATEQHLFVVINQKRQTLGIITLADIIEALLGKNPNDEFAEYHNKTAVAAATSEAAHDKGENDENNE